MDVLSEVLRGVRLTGAMFFDITARAPWGIGSPPTAEVRSRVMPGSEHLIAFHCVIEGEGYIRMRDLDPTPRPISAGDVILMPHGDAHVLISEPGHRVEPNLDLFYRPTDRTLPFCIVEGGEGAGVRMLCGYFGCDATPFNPLLDSLPTPTIIKAGPGCELVGMHYVTKALGDRSHERPGGELILSKLSELMLVQALRLHIAALPGESEGWLSGLRDPLVGRALHLMHGDPARDWTLDVLARAAGISRSVLAERFTRLVGEPPMTYLARWRMQLAAHALERPGVAIASVAYDVGYQSEAAFNRAFKKIVGMPPGTWRRNRQFAA